MSKNYPKIIRKVYGYLLSAVLAATAVCLITGCLRIYFAGSHPFSPSTVAQAFAPIAPVVYLCLALILGSFPLYALLPPDAEKRGGKRPYYLMLKRLQEKTDLSACGGSLLQSIEAQRAARIRINAVTAAISVVSWTVFLVYALNGEHFHKSEINASMIRAMVWFVPCLLVSGGAAMIREKLIRQSAEAEIALYKGVTGKAEAAAPTGNRRIIVLRAVLAAAAVTLLLAGWFSGGFADVMTKAVNICTECVGLG